MATDLRNMTPHDLRVRVGNDDNADYVTIPACGTCVRVMSKSQAHLGTLSNGIEVFEPPAFEDVLVGFPELTDASHPDLVVSMVVGNHIPGWYRGSVYVPDTGPASVIRDAKGGIAAVRRIYLVHRPSSATAASKDQ